ncbi:unnamed protein product [Auanema sp. JU1783]|nr:unnamed protein product [Auanema sp. JU1783]
MMRAVTIFFSVFGLLPSTALSDIIGIPTIDCQTDGIEARINLSRPFLGRIYLRGHYADDGCFHDFTNSSTTWAKPIFSYEACHMRRKRQANPHGLTMSAVMIISHHPKLVTYRDKAYNIECFYEQSDPSPVITDLNVSSNDNNIIKMRAETTLPVCNYHVEMKSVKVDEAAKDKLSVITVGDEVVHIWTCSDDQPNNLYCMQVHSCRAEDDTNDSVPVVDARGCIMDTELLSSIQYTSALRASASSRVFKFADKNDIRFQCQIRLTVRKHHLNETCPIPDCSKKDNYKKVWKRSLKEVNMDVATDGMTVIDKPLADHYHSVSDCTFIIWPFAATFIVFFTYFLFTIYHCCNTRRISQELMTIQSQF